MYTLTKTNRSTVITGLSSQPIDLSNISQQVVRRDCGAVVTFTGHVRSPNKNLEVIELNYEAYETHAEQQLLDIATTAANRYGLKSVAAIHRLGTLKPTDIAVAVAAAAPHRQAAFEGAAWLIDTIKSECAIWKQEVSTQGAEWVGIENCNANG